MGIEYQRLIQQLCDTGFTILNSALNATVHQAWLAPCCVSFHGLHSHKCFLPSLKPFSATLLLMYVLCVLNICLPVCFWCPRFTIWHRSSHCCLVDVYKCISFSSFSGTASVTGCLRTVTSPSCLLSECIHVGTWQSSIDYCCFVPNWCF